MMESIKTLLNGLRTAIMSELGKLRGVADAALTMASTQPDWAENDAAAAGYVKNRTHWSEWGDPVNETRSGWATSADGWSFVDLEFAKLLYANAEIAEYEDDTGACEFRSVSRDDGVATIYVGGAHGWTVHVDTESGRITFGDNGLGAFNRGAISIHLSGEIVHQIPEKYLELTTRDAAIESAQTAADNAASVAHTATSTARGAVRRLDLADQQNARLSRSVTRTYTFDGATTGLASIRAWDGTFYKIAECPIGVGDVTGSTTSRAGTVSQTKIKSGEGAEHQVGWRIGECFVMPHSGKYNFQYTASTSNTIYSGAGIYAHAGSTAAQNFASASLTFDGILWSAATINGVTPDPAGEITLDAEAVGATPALIPSSTAGSTKKFKITVDDTGALTATEVE